MTAGQSVVDALRAEGVEYIFGVVGSAFLEILDAMYGRTDIRFVGCRHEQGAGFMAMGYARATGRPGVCLVQNGPGVTNLLTCAAGALVCHAPMVILGGAPMAGQMYRDSFQELDQLGVFRPVCKAAIQINRADRAPEILRHAFRVATSGKMGPVYVDLPRDLLNAQDVDVEILAPEQYRPPQRPEGDVDRVREAAELLRRAESPAIVVGGGVVWGESHAEAVRLAEQLGAPIVASYERNDAVPNDHPLYVGPLGRAGSPEAAEATLAADVVLALGTRLSHFTSFYDGRYFSDGAKLVQVEIDQHEIGRNMPVDVGILGDAGAVARALSESLEEAVLPAALERRRAAVSVLRAKRLQRLDTEAGLDMLPMKPQRVYAVCR